MRARAALVFLAVAAALPATAEAPRLALPIDCTLGDSCYIQNYVDHDPTAAATDFTCSGLTYDGHKGTDFGLPSLAAMQAGVSVLAAAPGIVTSLRDGMPDTGYTPETAASIKDRECGNGVVIDHGDGLVTQYCHMKRGSISVRRGQRVETGVPLGQVGLSGHTEFPHLHLSVRRNKAVIDPFDADRRDTCAADAAHHSLWQDTPAYAAGGMLSAGFSSDIPSFTAVKSGASVSTLPADAPALVIWGYAFGTRAGDTMRLDMTGPSGFAFAQDVTLDKAQALVFRASGKRRPATGWPSGRYTGTTTLMRDGKVLGSHAASVDILP